MKRLILSLITLCTIQLFCLAQSAIDYKAIVNTGDGFLVCGNGDKIVKLDYWGEQIKEIALSQSYKLNDIAFVDDKAVAVGEKGTIVFLQDDKAEEITFGEMDFKTVVSSKGQFLLGIDQNVLRFSSELEYVDGIGLDLKGNIISMSSSDSGYICGITDRSEVFCSKDGERWRVLDFNAQYDSYYESISLISAAAGNMAFAIAGITESGKPAMFTSTDGSVWSQREMSYLDHGTPVAFMGTPSSIVYDKDNDRMLLICSGGEVFIVPNCSHCNSVVSTGGKGLSDASVNMGAFFVVGKQGYIYSSIEQ